jgi:hypothetical protein
VQQGAGSAGITGEPDGGQPGILAEQPGERLEVTAADSTYHRDRDRMPLRRGHPTSVTGVNFSFGAEFWRSGR